MLTRNYEVLNRNKKGGMQTSLLNIVMQLKKLCNHEFLMGEGAPRPFPTCLRRATARRNWRTTSASPGSSNCWTACCCA